MEKSMWMLGFARVEAVSLIWRKVSQQPCLKEWLVRWRMHVEVQEMMSSKLSSVIISADADTRF